ncbi:MAG: cupin domain-containing protein [Candidatus Kapabacteria bacterium]|nr:cupin domain-containing protein [Candidatus Kapabacteria bacterium]
MPTKGQIIVNPITGDTFEFLETSIDTQGKSVSIKTTLKSKGELVPNHFHLLQDESFTIISGKLNIWLNGGNQTLSENETITLPKNKAHNHFNNSDDEVTYVHYVSPALDFEYLIENLVGLASDGKMVNGKAGLIQELVTLKYLDSKAFLANIPVPIQKLLMNTIAPIARIFGYKAIYKKYSGIEK